MQADIEARYKALFEATLDGIMIVDDAGVYVDVNESMCRFLKTTREQLVGAHFSQFIPPELLEDARIDLGDLKAVGSFEGEFPVRAADGSLIELEWRSRAHFLPGLHFCVARDITARKRAEAEARRRQEELTDFVENATVGLHWVGPDGTILWANRAELELLGYSREEYVGHHIAEFHADAEAIQDILRRLSAREELHGYEARLRCKDGSIRHVLISSNVLWQEDRFVHTRCFTRDITERKEAEARRAAIMETALDAILTMDHEGRVREFNPAAERIFGYRRAEALGRPLAELIIPPSLREAHYRGLQRYLATGAAPVLGKRLELTAMRADGTEFPIELTITRISTEGPPAFTGYIRDITERKRAERRLAAEHAVTRVLAEAATVEEAAPRVLQILGECIEAQVGQLWEVDVGAQALRCTSAWARTGSPEIEEFQAASRALSFAPGVGLPGRVWQERKTTSIEELSRDGNFPRRAVAAAARLRGGVAFPLVTGDESFGVIEFFSEQCFELDPAFIRMLTAVGQDVGQFIRRRRAEESLAAERERLRVTLASIGDAVIVTDAGGHPTFLNPVAESLTGWRQEEAVGRNLSEVFAIVNEETRAAVDSPVARVLREGMIVGLANHTLLITRDGAERPIDDSAAPIRDAEGHVAGVVLVFRDVTERRRAEAELRDQQQLLRAITDNADSALVMVDTRGHFTFVNPAFTRITGYTEDDIRRGESHEARDEESDRPAGSAFTLVSRLMNLASGNLQPVRGHEDVFVRKDGSLFPVVAAVAPLEKDGRTAGGVIEFRDVTQEKAREQALAEADRRKDEFLAMLAHELRNPLSPIRNALYLLRLHAGDAAAVDRWREMMERQVGHMTRLVDDLLDVSRINRGKVALQRERLDLRRLLQLAVGDHQQALEGAGLAVELHVPPDPVWVLGDATRLTQVLDNLLDNARKFTERGGVVRAELALAEEEEAVITVTDTGIGIEAEMLPRLFDVFAQADRSLDRSRGGLGLGLALVKGLVELHGGRVEARSAGPGRGAEFILHLPLEPEPCDRSEQSDVGARRAVPLRVLIIEDNPDAAESLEALLASHGHEVSVVHSGSAGLEMATAHRPNVILCDIGLPGMDGFAVARAVRRDKHLSSTRLIALTGYGQEGDVERSRDAGFDEHLVKPVDPEQLLNRLL